MNQTPQLPGSPCVRACCLNDQDICMGCGRSLEEILGWNNADTEQREGIIARSRERQSASGYAEVSCAEGPCRGPK